MTVICFRAGRVAADRQLTSDRKTPIHKLSEIDDHELGRIVLATAGKLTSCVRFERWVRKGRKGRAPSTAYVAAMAVIRATRAVERWDAADGLLVRTEIARDYDAIGSGSQYALGAMSMGASARKAVLVAAEHDPYCGGGVDSVRVW